MVTYFTVSNLSLSFDCTVANTYPSVEFAEQFKKNRLRAWLDKWIAEGTNYLFSRGSLRGPAAKVSNWSCRYQPAFGSVTVEVQNALFSPPHPDWCTIRKLEDSRRRKDRKFGRKQFWVDFEGDVLVVDTVRRMGEDNPYYQMVPIDPLIMIRLFAKEEGWKIRRLAVGGGKPPTSEDKVMTWAAGLLCYRVEALRGRYTSTHLDLVDWKAEWLMGFQNIDKLLLDDTFDGDEPEGGPQDWDFLKPGRAKKKILSLLENARSQGPEWSAEVPNLKILGEADWNEYL